MNREIKFKVWCNENEQFIQFNKMGFLEDGSLWYVQGIDEDEKETDPPYFENQNDWELMQYTGLKDKKGVEIYEGDIVETQQSDLTSAPHEMVGGIVEWDSKNAMYKIKPIYGSKFHPITMFVHDVVVVGNKFEYPELLEREAECIKYLTNVSNAEVDSVQQE